MKPKRQRRSQQPAQQLSHDVFLSAAENAQGDEAYLEAVWRAWIDWSRRTGQPQSASIGQAMRAGDIAQERPTADIPPNPLIAYDRARLFDTQETQ